MRATESVAASGNKDQASEIVRRIQQVNNKIKDVEIRLASEVAVLSEMAESATRPLYHERDQLIRELEIYATAHRDFILPPSAGKKSLKMSCGRFGWRSGNWCAIISDEDLLITELESRGLGKYISTKKNLNKSMLIEDREQLGRMNIPGLAFEKGERFFVETTEPKLEPETVKV